MKDHMNRIKEMIKFIEIQYSTYALQVISEFFIWISRTINIIGFERRKILITKQYILMS